MPIETDLTLEYLDPSNTDPIAQGFCSVDGPNYSVRISSDDIPTNNGGYLELGVVTVFARGTATDIALQNIFADIEQGISDGIFQSVINNPSITSNFLCDLAAAAQLNQLTIPQYGLDFVTRLDGFEVGDDIRFLDEPGNIDVDLIVQTIDMLLVGTENLYDEFKYTINASPYIIDPQANNARLIQLSNLPIRVPNAKIQT